MLWKCIRSRRHGPCPHKPSGIVAEIVHKKKWHQIAGSADIPYSSMENTWRQIGISSERTTAPWGAKFPPSRGVQRWSASLGMLQYWVLKSWPASLTHPLRVWEFAASYILTDFILIGAYNPPMVTSKPCWIGKNLLKPWPACWNRSLAKNSSLGSVPWSVPG